MVCAFYEDIRHTSSFVFVEIEIESDSAPAPLASTEKLGERPPCGHQHLGRAPSEGVSPESARIRPAQMSANRSQSTDQVTTPERG